MNTAARQLASAIVAAYDASASDDAAYPRVLPAPPSGDTRYSIVTLAEFLCVPPAAVDAEIVPVEHGDSDDFHSARQFVSYRGSDGEDYGDVWLTHEAADRIAAELPTGLLARAVAAGRPSEARLAPDLVYALARHIVDYPAGA